MTYEPSPCAFADARPEEYPTHRYCLGWADSCAKSGCYRKRQAAQRRKADLAGYRKFPGNDVQQRRRALVLTAHESGGDVAAARLGFGFCQWCELEIIDPKTGARSKRRGWHDGRGDEPDCLWTYYTHTRQPEQLQEIARRDGAWCASCGEWKGRWAKGGEWSVERVERLGGTWLRHFPPAIFSGVWSTVGLEASLEVDHRLPLGLVAIVVPQAERWRWYGPLNLQGLCHRCHAAKTREDTRLIKIAKANPEAAARLLGALT